MKNYFTILILALIAATTFSCKKVQTTDEDAVKPASSLATSATTTAKKGYLVVSCPNCEVQYGMPDQYTMVSVSGTSAKAYFTYKLGYTLVTYITPLMVQQTVSIVVYDEDNNVIYRGSNVQPSTSYWEVHAILPGN